MNEIRMIDAVTKKEVWRHYLFENSVLECYVDVPLPKASDSEDESKTVDSKEMFSWTANILYNVDIRVTGRMSKLKVYGVDPAHILAIQTFFCKVLNDKCTLTKYLLSRCLYFILQSFHKTFKANIMRNHIPWFTRVRKALQEARREREESKGVE